MKRFLVIMVAILFSTAGLALAARAQDQGQAQVQAQDQAQAQAQDQAQAPDQDQNPGTAEVQPGVARVSLIHGNVSIQRGDSGDWVAATLNTPVVVGDRISTGSASRAEIQLDYANVIRLDENSTVKITALDRSNIQLQVGQGLVNYSVLEDGGASAEIDTPNVAVHPVEKGDYRIEVSSADQTEAVVRIGKAEVSVPQGSTEVDSGQMITVQGSDNPQYQTANAPARDDFDQWNSDRDHAIESASSWQHTDPYYTGSQDLDANGQWVNVPDYGWVWAPSEGPGWAPYRDGQWVWEPYYGWTWVSAEPWGWAPYHYGRWFVYGGSWCWWPGPVYAGYYPLWAPAYVSFFGWGGGVGFGFGFGHFGWLPLGPADPFYRWYGRRVGFVGGVRFAEIRNYDFRRGVYERPLFTGRNGFSNLRGWETNDRIRAGISSMQSDRFGRGPVPMHQGVLKVSELRQGSLMTGRLPVVPGRQSLGHVERNVPAGIARTANENNARFFSKSRPGNAFSPRPFSEQARQMQRMIADSHTNARQSAGNSRFGENAPQSRNGQTEGARSFPNAGGDQARSGQPQSAVRPGWHSFTPPSGSNGRQTQGNTRSSGNGNAGRPMPSRPAPSSPKTSSRPGWHSFTPPSGNGRGDAGRQSQPSQQSRPATQGSGSPAQARPGWHTFTPPSGGQRGGNSSYGRPQLDLHQPIATRRSSPLYDRGGYYGRPGGSYGRPSGGYSGRPSGGYSRPSGGGYSGRPSGGGNSGRPSGGGSRGGGGSHGSSHPSGGHPRR
jgi:Family of unknown function (DUF6600)/FecR protein